MWGRRSGRLSGRHPSIALQRNRVVELRCLRRNAMTKTLHDGPLEIVIHGRHSNVSERFKQFVNDKVSRIERFSVPVHRIDVEVSHEANPRQHDRAYEVELTCSGSGPFLRAEAHASDKYAALELAYAKLEERFRRMHERRRSVRHQRPQLEADVLVAVNEPESEEVDDPTIVLESGPLVVRTKSIETAVMSVEQAVEAMELVGHDFFLFENEQSGLPSVIYRRRGYDFGLVELGNAS